MLGPDGTPQDFNAPPPFVRRMWAGGSIEWNTSSPIPVGSEVDQSTQIGSAELKNGMIFVKQNKTISVRGSGTWSIKEQRTHVFRTEGGVSSVAPKAHPPPPPQTSQPEDTLASFRCTPTAALLFRYSALTFNAHRIHYDRDWAREIEGHQDLVVHGPLTATLVIELAATAAQKQGCVLSKFSYRATSPMYVDRDIRMEASLVGDSELELVAVQEGKMGMKATATMSRL